MQSTTSTSRPGDKTELKIQLDIAAQIIEASEGLDPSSIEELKAVMEEAQRSMTTATPWNRKSLEAVENLKEAIDNVRHQADKSTLTTVIAKAESIDLSEYIEEGQDTFKAALESAKEIYDDPSATQEEVDAAADALNAAITAPAQDRQQGPSEGTDGDCTVHRRQRLYRCQLSEPCKRHGGGAEGLDDNTLAEDDPAAGTTIRNMETRLSAAINSLVENSGNSGSGSGSGSSSSSGSTPLRPQPLQRRTSLWTT